MMRWIVLCFVLLISVSCNRRQTPNATSDDNLQTLRVLYERYKRGKIERCMLDGAVVYKAGLSAADAGSVIFNWDGVKIGSCNYGWGTPDSACHELQGCDAIYRVANNIWDEPAVDKYGLAN